MTTYDRSLPYQRQPSQKEPRTPSVAPQAHSRRVYIDANEAASFALHLAQEEFARPSRVVAHLSLEFANFGEPGQRTRITRRKLARLMWCVRWLQRRALWTRSILLALQAEPQPANVIAQVECVYERAEEAYVKLEVFGEFRSDPEPEHGDWWFYHLCSSEALKRLMDASGNASATLRAYAARVRKEQEGGAHGLPM